MRKKIMFIFLILFMFLLSGCDVEYHLKYNSLTFYEDITLSMDNSSNNQITKKYLEDTDFFAVYNYPNTVNYHKNIYENDNKIIAKFSAKYRKELFNMSRILDECFPTYNVITEEDGNTIISTGKGFYCWDYEWNRTNSIKVVLETDNKIIQHNAHEVDGNKLIWNITKENKDDITFMVEISNKIDQTPTYIAKDFVQNQGLLVFGIIGFILIAGVIVLIVYSIGKKKNEI